jgi:hypothetical protein
MRARQGHNGECSGGPGMRPGTMQSAEARSRSLRYKEYKRIHDAQNFARRLGIGVVDYGGRTAIANLTNHARPPGPPARSSGEAAYGEAAEAVPG